MLGILARRAHSRRGLTLIEILIALIILMVGLVGIFALFPVGIKSTQESVEDSTAALLAESFHHALIAAMRASRPANGANDTVEVALCHDGLTGKRFDGTTSHNATTGSTAGPALPDNTYVFALPSVADANRLYTYPRTGTGAGTAPRQALFRMSDSGGTQTYLRRCLMGAGTRTAPDPGTVWFEDPTEAIDQYYVCFDVTRVQDQANGYSQPLFEFQIGIYRNYQDRGAQGWTITNNVAAAITVNTWTTTNHPDRKKVFRTLIAGN